MNHITPSDKIPYIPDVNRIFDYYIDALNANNCSQIENNAYFNFLISYNLLIKTGSTVKPSENYNLTDEATREKTFLRFLNNLDITKKIIENIGDNGKTISEIASKLNSEFSTNDIRVVIAWLEHLNQIMLYGNKYIFTNEVDDTENKESIYPLNCKDTLDISEDKYSVFEYLRKIKSGKILISPDFQRNVVWTNMQKSRFIESAILQIPIPPFYMKKLPNGNMVIIDGQQRTAALSEYLNNKFALIQLEALSDLNGMKFKDLEIFDSSISTKIEDKQLFFYVLGSSVPMAAVYDIFNRINTGGTKLERQEIRNCVFIGKSTEFLKKIAKSKIFLRSINEGISDNRMKAREAILRCIAFAIHPLEAYQGSIDDFLERTMKKLNSMSSIEINDLENTTLKTFNLTYEFFGLNNFRIPGKNSRGRINVAVMEVIFHCFWNKNISDFPDKDKIINSFNELIRDSSFLESFRISTSSKSGVKKRFELAHKYLDYDK